MGMNLLDYLVSTAIMAASLACLFIAIGALFGIWAWFRLGVDVLTAYRKAQKLPEDEFIFWWTRAGQILWQKLQK